MAGHEATGDWVSIPLASINGLPDRVTASLLTDGYFPIVLKFDILQFATLEDDFLRGH